MDFLCAHQTQLAIAKEEEEAAHKAHHGHTSSVVKRLLAKFKNQDLSDAPGGTTGPTKGAMERMNAHMKHVEGQVSSQINGIQRDIDALRKEQDSWGDEDNKEEEDLKRMVAMTKQMKNDKMRSLVGRR